MFCSGTAATIMRIRAAALPQTSGTSDRPQRPSQYMINPGSPNDRRNHDLTFPSSGSGHATVANEQMQGVLVMRNAERAVAKHMVHELPSDIASRVELFPASKDMVASIVANVECATGNRNNFTPPCMSFKWLPINE